MDNIKLIDIAKNAAKNAYAPYSNYYVGAALITQNNKIYTGVNIENSSFAATICAERVAFAKAISEGEKIFKAIAVCGTKLINNKFIIDENCTPCGICRQTIAEFCNDDFKILIATQNSFKEFTLKELFYNGFKL